MILPLILVFAAVSLLVYALTAPGTEDAELYRAMRRRRRGFLLWITPALRRTDGWIRASLGPNNAMERTLRSKLRFVGSTYPLDADELLAAQLLGLATVPPAAAVLLALGIHFGVVPLSPQKAALVVVLLAAAFLVLPVMPIDSIVKRRRADVQRNWAFFLDLFSIALGSGAGTQGALERVTAAIQSGALAEELRRVLNEIRLGSSRSAALRSFAARAKLPDVSTSIELIVQSEELGTELSGMLADQARGFRQAAMQRVEKKALQAPTKMLLPMAIFIFPTILGILIGPVLISYFVSQ